MRKKEREPEEDEEPDFNHIQLDLSELEIEDFFKEVGRHPYHIKQVGEFINHLAAELDVEQSQLKVIYGDLSRQIRDDPTSYGLEKATDNSVKDIIPTQRSYQKQERRIRRLKQRLDDARVLLAALGDRKRCMEIVSKGIELGVWSDPKMTKEVGEKIQERKTKRLRHMGKRTKER